MIPVRTGFSGESYKLFDDYNEVHLFVEDAGFENLYKALLGERGIRLEQVFSKNGKRSVLESARECTDPRCIFIVDRDWDDLLGTLPIAENVVVLSKHSIESYLIEHNAFCKVLIGEDPKCNIEVKLDKSTFKEIVKKISLKLRPLFECFATMQINGSSEVGAGNKPGRFQVKNKSCEVDESAISIFIANIGDTVDKRAKAYFAQADLRTPGHGKYMLHFIWQSIRIHASINQIKTASLMIRLAQLIDSRDVDLLADEIKEVSNELVAIYN